MLIKKSFLVIFLSAFWVINVFALETVDKLNSSANKVAIASAHPLATQAGLDIIQSGGNVFDAAVAVSAALAVVEPSGSGLGGGGYWLLHRASDGFETMIDGREKAPLAAKKSMFLDEAGQIIPKLSLDGALAAAIPGMPAAIVHLSEKYGRLTLSKSLAPAINYAQNGFAVGHKFLRMLKSRRYVLKKDKQAAQIFLHGDKLPEVYSILRQPDLATTLKLLATWGREGFYAGSVADNLIDSVNKSGGIWTKEDLKSYQIVEREPVRGVYQGIIITSAAPSSSGGIVLIEALNILAGFDLQKSASITRKHLITEALQRAYHDRSFYLGDPDLINIPINRLVSQDYAAGIRTTIRPDKAMPSSLLAGETSNQTEGDNTSHFSIMDSQGNRVAATLSINFPFGAGFVAAGTGVLLNNEMDDFVSQPGVMNGYGLVGGEANSIAPSKRMLSSMTPTFLENDATVGVLGTPGGSRIISMVLLAVLDFAQGNSPKSWVSLPRLHHQFLPDIIEYENNALTSEELAGLAKMGHQLRATDHSYGDMQAVSMNKKTKTLSAASDLRGEGRAIVAN
jgi:gamma-glutamyltranspeptidase / glutathione hydrolase